jgi:hypothetical protein
VDKVRDETMTEERPQSPDALVMGPTGQSAQMDDRHTSQPLSPPTVATVGGAPLSAHGSVHGICVTATEHTSSALTPQGAESPIVYGDEEITATRRASAAEPISLALVSQPMALSPVGTAHSKHFGAASARMAAPECSPPIPTKVETSNATGLHAICSEATALQTRKDTSSHPVHENSVKPPTADDGQVTASMAASPANPASTKLPAKPAAAFDAVYVALAACAEAKNRQMRCPATSSSPMAGNPAVQRLSPCSTADQPDLLLEKPDCRLPVVPGHQSPHPVAQCINIISSRDDGDSTSDAASLEPSCATRSDLFAGGPANAAMLAERKAQPACDAAHMVHAQDDSLTGAINASTHCQSQQPVPHLFFEVCRYTDNVCLLANWSKEVAVALQGRDCMDDLRALQKDEDSETDHTWAGRKGLCTSNLQPLGLRLPIARLLPLAHGKEAEGIVQGLVALLTVFSPFYLV